MEKDREEICKIMSDMLDNPDDSGVYPTSTAYTRLEHYIEMQRIEALGWMHGFCCLSLDNGSDPRIENVPDIIEKAINNLNGRR